ncbi:Protein NRT1/ PTR FAMILY 5 [Arachis hypogaea]|nr:Protein NRT1/ PTR FAMILY 5 [Arachis hypogaea]
MLPSLNNPECQVGSKLGSCATETQVILFFISLYLVAIAQGGHKSCVQAFGADQFDEQHPKEFKDRSSFFNWWYFTMCAGKGHGKSPFLRIGRVFVTAARNRQAETIQEETSGTLPPQISQQFNFLNKALLAPDCSIKEGNVTCSVVEVEEAKAVLRLVPIWATTLPFATVFAQAPTFFTKQGFTLDRTILCLLLCLLKPLPAASLQTLIALAIVVISPIYDRIFVPIARAITRQILRHHNATKNWDWDFYIDI